MQVTPLKWTGEKECNAFSGRDCIHSCHFHFSASVWTFSDLLKVQNVRIPKWRFPCFIFLWTLTRVPAVSYISPQPQCKLSRHWWCRPHLKKLSQFRPPKTPLTKKNVFLCTQNFKGAWSWEYLFFERSSLHLWQEASVHFSTGGSTSGSSSCRRAWIGKADGWMHCG